MSTRHSNLWRTTVATVAIVFVSGCSATKDYEETIAELKTALEGSVETVSKIDEAVTKEENERWAEKIISDDLTLIASEATCVGGAGKCSLEIVKSGEPPTILAASYPIQSKLTKTKQALAALQGYLSSLLEITQVDTAGKVAEQTNKALASLRKIKDEVAIANGTDPKKGLISSYSEPVGALFNWAVEQYVQEVKHEALAQATKRAQPAIDGLDNLLSGVGDAVTSSAIAKAEDTFQDAQGAYDKAETSGALSKANINAYITAVAVYDQALKAKATRPLAEFAIAHRKLKMFLNREGDVSLADAWAAIQGLKEKAKGFQTLIENLKK